MAKAQIPFAVAQSNNLRRTSVEVRQVVIQLLYYFEGLSQNEIADILHMTQASVSRSMKSFALHRKKEKSNANLLKIYDLYRLKYKAVLAHEKQNVNITD